MGTALTAHPAEFIEEYTSPFGGIGYGIGYGIPWMWAYICTGVTVYWVKKELARERRDWNDVVRVHREKPLHLVETQDDREAYERMMRRNSMRITRAQTMPMNESDSSPETSPVAPRRPRPVSSPPNTMSRPRTGSIV